MLSFHEKASDLVPPGQEANVEEGGRKSNDCVNDIWPIDALFTLLKQYLMGQKSLE